MNIDIFMCVYRVENGHTYVKLSIFTCLSISLFNHLHIKFFQTIESAKKKINKIKIIGSLCGSIRQIVVLVRITTKGFSE
jgi:phosphorylcholine metabolism protein LicD